VARNQVNELGLSWDHLFLGIEAESLSLAIFKPLDRKPILIIIKIL